MWERDVNNGEVLGGLLLRFRKATRKEEEDVLRATRSLVL